MIDVILSYVIRPHYLAQICYIKPRAKTTQNNDESGIWDSRPAASIEEKMSTEALQICCFCW